ncbi:uncharacterized protein [Procambarus clarkii]|uniref:uncharacterized protein n=1 Tax=Procambarus clarkii TaxID=6728 RepID=UPI0037430272
MRLAALVLVATLAATAAGEDQTTRTRRSIGSWISDFFKKWKKEDSEDDYGGQQIITIPVYQPRPIYHPPVVHHQKPYYPPPSYGPPSIPPTSYGRGFGGGGQFKGGFGGGGPIPGGFGGGGPIKGGFGGGGPIKGGFGGGGPIKGGFGGGGPIKGGYGGGGHGGGGHIKGGFGGGGHGGGGHIKGGFGGGGHGGGGHIKGGFGGGGHGGGGHIKGGFGGGGGHIKGGGGHGKGVPYGFGPVKDSDVVHGGGGSYHPPALPAGDYGVPPPLPLDTYAAPNLDDIYGPPKIVDSYSTLAIPKAPVVSSGLGDSYIPPVAPVGPSVNDLVSDFRTPHSLSGAGAGAGLGAISSYVDFEPSQPLPIEPIVPEVPLVPKGPPAPLAALYELPGDGGALSPAPVDILPPGNGIFDVGGSKRSIDGGFGASAGVKDQYSAPTAPLTFGAELGYDDPIIEIVFEDGEPAPPLPPPVIDPEVFALPEEPVEVYFIEYSPGDNIDDIAALNLEGAKPGILHDLPEELPIDVRSHLLDSGVLDNAEIQVINLDDALTQGYLDRDTREALEAVYASESRRDEKKVDAPSKEGVNIKVHRLMNEDGTPKGVAELLSGLGKYREGRFAGVVEANDEDKKKFIPVIVDGDKLPLPNHPGLDGREVAGVLVLAPGNKNKTSEPPANTSTPVHNLVESASNSEEVVTKIDQINERVDRQWNGDPNGWRPVWD